MTNEDIYIINTRARARARTNTYVIRYERKSIDREDSKVTNPANRQNFRYKREDWIIIDEFRGIYIYIEYRPIVRERVFVILRWGWGGGRGWWWEEGGIVESVKGRVGQGNRSRSYVSNMRKWILNIESWLPLQRLHLVKFGIIAENIWRLA